MDSQYKLGGIEDIVAEMEELLDIPDELVEGDEEYQIIRCGWWVYIPALDLCLHEGAFLVYDEKEQEFMPDFSITLIRENGQDGWLYPQVTLVYAYADTEMKRNAISKAASRIDYPSEEAAIWQEDKDIIERLCRGY